MKSLIEYLRDRVEEVQARMAVANGELQLAQAKQQAAVIEFNSYQSALNAETKREAHQAALIQQQQQSLNLPESSPEDHRKADGVVSEVESPSSESVPEINKTELIKNVLRQNPSGLSPAGIWTKVKDDITRPYLYAVLKRLKDKEQVVERRGKYRIIATAKNHEQGESSTLLQ